MSFHPLRAVLHAFRSAGARGALGIVLVFVAAGSLNLWAMPILAPNDEARHMGYAMALADGRIPHVLEPIDLEATKLRYLRGTNIQAAAAHPPLYHGLVALPLKASARADKVWIGVRFARALALLFGVASVLYAHRLLRLLLPARPDLALAASAMVATFPMYVGSSSIAYGDSLGALGFVATLASSVDAAINGLTVRRYLLCCFWFAIASLSRLPVLVAVSPALLALAVPKIVAAGGAPARGLGPGLVRSAGVLVAGLLAGGWFYALNISRYGDPSASGPLLQHLEREPIPMIELLFSTDWQRLFEYQWGSLIGSVRKFPVGAFFSRAVLFLTLCGLGIQLVRWVRTRKSERRPPRDAAGRTLLFTRVVAAVCVAAALALLFYFRSKGGLLTARYVMPFAWAVALVISFSLAWPRRPFFIQTVLSSFVFFLYVTIEQYSPIAETDFDDMRLGLALRAAGLPAPDAMLVAHCFVMIAGAALIVHAVGALYPRPEEVPP